MTKSIEEEIKKLEEELSLLPTEEECRNEIKKIDEFKALIKEKHEILLNAPKNKSHLHAVDGFMRHTSDSEYFEIQLRSKDKEKLYYRMNRAEASMALELIKDFLGGGK